MRTRLFRRLALASAAVMLVSVVAAPVTSAADDFSASCTFTGSAVTGTFDPSGRTGNYFWVWRTGTSVIDYGSARLAADDTGSDTGSVPGSITLDSSSVVKFGVVKGTAAKYSYVTCTWAG